MRRTSMGLAMALLASAAAQAASVSTTITVTNATGSALGAITSSNASLTILGAGGATLTGTFTISNPSLVPDSSSNLSEKFTLTFSGGTMAGTLKIPASVLAGGTQTATGSATIDSGTGSFSGYTGNFATVSGSGSFVLSTLAVTLSFTGSGTINTGGSTGGDGGANTPTIASVLNNYSGILPGLPNYGIAPGTIFVIYGTNLSTQPATPLQSSAAPGLPKTLNGTSISVTVNGTTTTPTIYYTSPTQVAAVLPSSTPVGTGTITVTSGGQPSAAAPIQVVKSAFGLDTLLGTGTGAGVATDASGNVPLPASSATPGQSIVLWGSGLGADTANDDTTYPQKQDDLTSALGVKVYIGGILANVAYAGRSQYPGLDQINVAVPNNVAPGCGVSVVVTAGTPLIVSNAVTIPVAANGGACSDPNFGITGTMGQTLEGKSTVNFGFVTVTQDTSGSPATTTNTAGAIFQSVSGIQFAGSAGSSASIGSCIVSAATVGSTSTIPTIHGLDAGSINMTGPGGSVALTGIPQVAGFYGAQLSASAIPAAGGSFSFTGTGGKDVGAFTTTLNFPAPLVWTNMASISSVTRSQGVTVNWTGGGTSTYVTISGSSAATINGQFTSVAFTCNAPVSAGTFTVPPPVLLALPAGNGSLSVGNYTNPQTFTASGLDLAFVTGGAGSAISPAYN